MPNSDLNKSIQRLYLDMTLMELKNLNQKSYGKFSYISNLYLNIIATTPNCTASYMAKLLGVTKSAITIRLNELIEKGIVVKEQSPEDKRVYYLFINENIAQEFREFDEKLKDLVNKMEQEFSTQEIACCCKILESFGKLI